jgi:hypothetical protein
MAVVFQWQAEETPAELHDALRMLSEQVPVAEGRGAVRLRFAAGADPGECQVRRSGDEVTVTYGGVSDALRGLGTALARVPEDREVVSEQRHFATLGIMLDCSRNAVMKVEHLKWWLRCLALFGYNMVMLYTEDTYALPDEPFFGVFRGAYRRDELAELDTYASRLGIELIACIQTLGHLEQMLKWPAYGEVRDTERELLVGEPKTYELIDKMVAQCSDAFASRRIHVGMDETWTLGRGRFLDLRGHKSGYEILTEHLAKVVDICRRHGLRPMIWSDMFFKFGGNMHTDYDVESGIPDEVRDAIPEDLDLVYWDYNREEEEDYLRLIERHRQLARDPIMASGVWTWLRLWYGRKETEATVAPCVRACRKAGLKEIFFTMWGDDGGYCEFDSALTGLAFAAAECYGEELGSLEARHKAVCGIGYEESLLGSQIEFPPLEVQNRWGADCMAAATLWDDPLLGMHWRSLDARHPGHWPKAAEHYRALSAQLARHRGERQAVDLAHAAALAELLSAKIGFRMKLEQAYSKRDRGELEAVLDSVPGLVGLTEQLEESFRRQWLRRNKPFGLEALQVRLGGLRQRFLEAGRALRELLAGEQESIAELDEGLSLSEETLGRLYMSSRYRGLATPGIL